MNVEQRFSELSRKLREEIKESVEQIMMDVEADILPHCEGDTEFNVSLRAQEAVYNLLAGHVHADGEYMVVTDRNGMTVRLRVSTSEYDALRENLIMAMPKCPKDLKIEQLESQIRAMMDIRSAY